MMKGEAGTLRRKAMPKERNYKAVRHHVAAALIVLSALVGCGAVTARSQTSVEAFRKALREQAAFTDGDLSALEQGGMAAKLLPPKDKREVAVAGLVRLQVPQDAFIKFTRDNIARVNNERILQIGKFSNPPTIEDLQTLTLENRDIEDMKSCVVGDCDMKMSAAMIERVRNEVDWTAPDYRLRATLLFRQLLLDYVRDYLAHGEAALMEYGVNKGVNLAEEHRSLLAASVYFNQFAPEFTTYLRDFPKPEIPGVENALFWSKLKFGLKPVVTVTHVTIWTRPANVAPQVVVASQQIYADHYFDSSLALSAFIKLAGTKASADAYLLYTNRSRADTLGGMFSGLKRAIVESEAMDGLKTILQEQKVKIEASANGPSNSTTQFGTEVITPVPNVWELRFAGVHLVYVLLLALSIALVVYWLIKRRANQR
jgi:hypothetical protein